MYWSYPKRERICIPKSTWYSEIVLKETTNSENELSGVKILYGVKISVEDFKTNRKSLDRQNQKMTMQSEMTHQVILRDKLRERESVWEHILIQW